MIDRSKDVRLADLADTVSRGMIGSVSANPPTDLAVTSVTEILTSETSSIFELIIFAYACHSAADWIRCNRQGPEDISGFFHASGQDLMSRACAIMDNIVTAESGTASATLH